MHFPTLMLLLGIPLLMAGCGSQPAAIDANAPGATAAAAPPTVHTEGSADAPAAAATAPDADGAGADGALPAMVVHKSPSCGCCLAWADQMQAAGFAVELRDVDDVSPIKQALGVPASSASCHTAEVGGYFIEGHVPAADIRRLLDEQPDARGLAVPGMPVGSPGMEVPSGERQPFEVLLVGRDGSTAVFARHGD